ncbi:hypothetical protein LXA53_17600, partial [Erwinia amylovora]|nr:hypothetical protein [Erwinia amylovora]
RLADLMAESHASIRQDFESTVPAVEEMVEIVKHSLGDRGGVRITGGGVGGCVVALLPREVVASVQAAGELHYEEIAGLKETGDGCS